MMITKKLLSSLLLFLVCLSPLYQPVIPGLSQSSDFDIYNLGVHETMSSLEKSFTRTVALRTIRNYSVINLSVVNIGEPLNSITVQVKIASDLIVETFSASEKSALSEIISYQFEFPQNLYVALNRLASKDLLIEISVILDPVINWREPDVGLVIQNVELVCFDQYGLEEGVFSDIYFLPRKQMFYLKPSKYAFLRKKIVIKGMLFVNIPNDKIVDCIMEMKIDKVNIITVSLEEKLYSFNNENEIRFNFSINSKPAIHILSLIVEPDYELLSSETNIRVDCVVKGKYSKESPTALLDSEHPIPELIMLPILLFTLFGLPYYHAYQDMLTKKDEEILIE